MQEAEAGAMYRRAKRTNRQASEPAHPEFFKLMEGLWAGSEEAARELVRT
jgi:hypothetical protein